MKKEIGIIVILMLVTIGISGCVDTNGDGELSGYLAFTEVDEGTNIVVTANRITFTDMTRGVKSYVIKDYGDGYFTDFVHTVEFQIDSGDYFEQIPGEGFRAGLAVIWAVTNNYYTYNDMRYYDEGLGLSVDTVGLETAQRIRFTFRDFTDNDYVQYNDVTSVLGVKYHLAITRSGTNAICEIYDASHELLSTLQLDAYDTPYSTIVGLSSREDLVDTDQEITGFVENLVIS